MQEKLKAAFAQLTQIIDQPKQTLKPLACAVLSLNMTYASAQIESTAPESDLQTQSQTLGEGYVNTAGFTFQSQMDSSFLKLREAAKKGDEGQAIQLAQDLQNYDMPAYVEYYQIMTPVKAGQSMPQQQVRDYLYRYPHQPISDKMRGEYLVSLAKMRDWENFKLEYFKWVQRDNDEVECYRLLSQIESGKYDTEEIKKQALEFLNEPGKYGQGGIDLVKALYEKQIFSSEQLKLFIVIAAQKKHTTIAKRLFTQIGVDAEYKNDFFKIVAQSAKNPTEASNMLEVAKSQQTVDAAEYAMLNGLIGEGLARNLNDAAKNYYTNATLKNIYTMSPNTQEWQVRNALKQKDWQWVKAAIEQMPEYVRKKDNAMNHPSNMWDYWYAKSLEASGNTTASQKLLQEVKKTYNFYGALATEDLGQLVTLPPQQEAKKERVQEMSKRRSLQQAKRLVDLGLRDEARREWNWEAKLMNDEELIDAAQLAQQMELIDRSIYTADRTKTVHNFKLRYPMPLFDVLQTSAQKADVDLAFIYGLTRQESRFIKSARSGVGASGLMQVMPATASWVANKIGMDWPKSKFDAQYKLNDINVNTLLGAHYIRLLGQDLENNDALIAAGYNAGPGRPKKWRMAFAADTNPAVFIENIPFNETRDYVKNVIANTVYYRGLLQNNNPQSIKNLIANMNFQSNQSTTELP